MNTQQSVAFLKRRKFLLVLPVLVLPFMTMGFAALGGGSGGPLEAAPHHSGLNLALPDAEVKGLAEQDKMSLYEKEQKVLKDSTRLSGNGVYGEGAIGLGSEMAFKSDPAEAAITAKLAQINAQVNAPAAVVPLGSSREQVVVDPGLNPDVLRLEQLMKSMREGSGEQDPELAQLNGMMDKILAIQNPELSKLSVGKADSGIEAVVSDSVFHAFPAVVAGTVKATQGSVIELRLLDTVRIAGLVIPKGHSVFGVAEFSNQRIALEIRNIRLGTSIVPVSLSVYDKRDGMRGINAPEALFSDALGTGGVDAMGSVGLMGLDQNLGTQIAGAGIGAAKGLLSKKIKRVKQKLAAGYPVLLRDNSGKLKK